MFKCANCGYENKKGSRMCINCGSKFFMGMTVTKTYKYNQHQKKLLTMIKYLFLGIDIYFLWQCVSIFLETGDASIETYAIIILALIFTHLPGIAICFFIYKMLDFSLKNAEFYDAGIDVNKENKL